MPAQNILMLSQQAFVQKLGQSVLGESFFFDRRHGVECVFSGASLFRRFGFFHGSDGDIIKVENLATLPRLIRAVTQEELRAFFLAQAKKLMS